MLTPAAQAAQLALDCIYACINKGQSFILEAGAGSGKTETLIRTLKYLTDKQGVQLLRNHQKIACITYTNVAKKEIDERTDGHPAVFSSTIHTFCWSIIKNFQSELSDILLSLPKWNDQLIEQEEINLKTIVYELGYRKVEDTQLLLHHDDVLALTAKLLEKPKFRMLFTNRYPILFVDEYQDMEGKFAYALTSLLDSNKNTSKLLIGFFGDYWQKIYGNSCGKLEHPNLEVITQKSNFRSVATVVNVLNLIRPELPQEVVNSHSTGSAIVYHTNAWKGKRREDKQNHWTGDLPSDIANQYLELIINQLTGKGWDFSSKQTKILMLTHSILAQNQGYCNISEIFPYNDSFIKKEDPYIKFFVEILEPVCEAYENKLFGKMFDILKSHTPVIRAHADKLVWAEAMAKLMSLRKTGTIGDIIDLLRETRHPRLSENLEIKEQKRERWLLADKQESDPSMERLCKLREISYQEVISLAHFINEHTPFATQHGVKGAEFENVLVVVGRGWNQYNFGEMLEWFGSVPPDKQAKFERSRNLFYVVCSRPKKRLSILFTQKLSEGALEILNKWFGKDNVHSVNNII